MPFFHRTYYIELPGTVLEFEYITLAIARWNQKSRQNLSSPIHFHVSVAN